MNPSNGPRLLSSRIVLCRADVCEGRTAAANFVGRPGSSGVSSHTCTPREGTLCRVADNGEVKRFRPQAEGVPGCARGRFDANAQLDEAVRSKPRLRIMQCTEGSLI